MRKLLLILSIPALFGSCGIYTSYKRPDVQTEGLFRDTMVEADTVSLGQVHWRNLFTDPQLQCLIEQALQQNTDLRTADLRVQEAEAALLASRLSFLPSLFFSPQGVLSSFDGAKPTKTYSIPVAASWELDFFGKLRNANERTKAQLEQTKIYRQAVQTGLIATVANVYYSLCMLDKQLDIAQATSVYWKKNVATMRAMKLAGMTTEDAVAQSEANCYAIESSVVTLQRQIHETENTLANLLALPAQAIRRGSLEGWHHPDQLMLGLPLQLLANRPDVMAAEWSLRQAFYTTNVARSAFYPSVTLSGSAGWTNNAGGMIVNPGKWLLTAAASLTQPLFARGANIAQLKVAKAQQEEAQLAFQQVLLEAGSEVNNALVQCQTAQEKVRLDSQQVTALERALRSTELKMQYGNTTYLEVLYAQESLLQTQLTYVADRFDEIQGVIQLYHALGGGWK